MNFCTPSGHAALLDVNNKLIEDASVTSTSGMEQMLSVIRSRVSSNA